MGLERGYKMRYRAEQMFVIINAIEQSCVLVALTLVLFFVSKSPLYSLIKNARRTTKTWFIIYGIFFLMALIEELAAFQHTPMNTRIIAACAAGLLAGPEIGLAVGLSSILLSTILQHHWIAGLGLNMLIGGGLGGFLFSKHPHWAHRPQTGFWVGATSSFCRYPISWCLHHFLRMGGSPPFPLLVEMEAAIINGGGTALVLYVIQKLWLFQFQAQAQAMAEVRALQARMNPHFIYNALNTVAALSQMDPEKVPDALAKLALFLRAKALWERHLIPLDEEIRVVKAYVEIEQLRFRERLQVVWRISSPLENILVPPFLLQPLVENAIQHGLYPKPQGGTVVIEIEKNKKELCIGVKDTGVGIPAAQLEGLWDHPSYEEPHALYSLKRRLELLYGGKGRLLIWSSPSAGTHVLIYLPIVHNTLSEEKTAYVQRTEAATGNYS